MLLGRVTELPVKPQIPVPHDRSPTRTETHSKTSANKGDNGVQETKREGRPGIVGGTEAKSSKKGNLIHSLDFQHQTSTQWTTSMERKRF